MARKGDEITSGESLNSYEGNANLGTGEGSGYARPDLSPLTTFAQNLYRTHQIDFEQQQKDKSKLEDLYNDPKIYLQLDKNYADQLAPLNQQILELGKKNLQMDPNGEDWYKFMDTHNQLVSENAKLKAVQDTKNQYKKLADESADPHEKERINAYVDQLNNYKLGQEIPAYNKYFAFDEKHLPDLKVATGTRQVVTPDGKKIQTVKFNTYNPLNADKLAADQIVRDPEAAQTGVDIAHTLLTHGGTGELNTAMTDTYKKGLVLNIGQLQDKYKTDFTKYVKTNPNATFKDFMGATGKGTELQDIYDGMKYLNNRVQYIPTTADNGQKLSGYTYSDDGTKRLNVDDNTLRAIYAATKNVPGTKDEVADEKINLDPKTEFEAAQKLKIEREETAQKERESKREDATKRYIANLKDLQDGKTKTTPELPFTPLPSIFAGIGEYNKRVKLTDLPISQVAAINPNWIDAKGQLKNVKDIGDIEISVGKDPNNKDAVFVTNVRKGKQEKNTVNESQLKSNAEFWLATYAKERKGQEVYGFINELYQGAKGKNALTGNLNTDQPTGRPVMKNKADYYSQEGNVNKVEGNTVTYKDGTVWDFSSGKGKQIK